MGLSTRQEHHTRSRSWACCILKDEYKLSRLKGADWGEGVHPSRDTEDIAHCKLCVRIEIPSIELCTSY